MLAQVYEQRILGLFEKQSPGLKKAWSEGYKDPEGVERSCFIQKQLKNQGSWTHGLDTVVRADNPALGELQGPVVFSHSPMFWMIFFPQPRYSAEVRKPLAVLG